jgi:hypothetical protein
MDQDSADSNEKASTTFPGTVEKIIKPADPREPEKAQMAIEGAEELSREIRVDNVLKDEKGEDVALKKGAPVDVTIEADSKDTINKEGLAASFRQFTSFRGSKYRMYCMETCAASLLHEVKV